MKIKEKFIESKTGKMIDCEDGLFINDNYIVIVDGATSKNSIKVNGKSSGCYIKDIILESMEKLPIGITAVEAINFLNINIKISKNNLPDDFQMSASIIIYSDSKKEIWNYGDCQCIINSKKYLHQNKIDLITSNKRSKYNKKLLNNGFSVEKLLEKDLGREHIYPILKEQYKLINRFDIKYGYPALNGMPINEKELFIYKLKKDDQITLSSDGYPCLKDNLKESEEYLKEVLKDDPLLIDKYKTTKSLIKGNSSFDDRSYVSFIV